MGFPARLFWAVTVKAGIGFLEPGKGAPESCGGRVGGWFWLPMGGPAPSPGPGAHGKVVVGVRSRDWEPQSGGAAP